MLLVVLCRAGLGTFHAAKSQVVAACAGFTFASSAHHITCAILGCTEKRAPAMNMLFLFRLRGIKRSVRSWRIVDNPSICQLLVIVGTVPIPAPLPNITSHVIEAIIIGGK